MIQNQLPNLLRRLQLQGFYGGVPGAFERPSLHDLFGSRYGSSHHAEFIQPQAEQDRDCGWIAGKFPADADPFSLRMRDLNDMPDLP